LAFDSQRIVELRDQLLERGPESIVPGQFSKEHPLEAAAYDRVQPFAEAMFLVMSADAGISTSELDVLRGALRTLTDGELGTLAMEAMLADLEAKLERDGPELRMDNVAAHVWPDPKDRELMLVLAIATATADGQIQAAETQAIFELAARLGVSSERVLSWLGAQSS